MNRNLPRGSASPGPFDPSRTPYLAPIYEAVVNARHRRIVLVMATQCGKTELLLNLMGHQLDDADGGILFVAASQRQAEAISASRIQPMLDNSPTLSEKLDRRENRNKLTEKYIGGQRMGVAWAGSPAELASHACSLVLIDELDRMSSSVGLEGDVVALAEARTATFPAGKTVIVSSPTLEGASRIWQLFESGTAQRWAWPCSACGAFFIPCFELLRWPEGSTAAQAQRTAWLECPHCQAHLEERDKAGMNERGAFELTGDPDSGTASFWISGLCSPWRTWGQCAAAWIEAAHSHEPEQIQAAKNVIFGELYKLQGEAPPAAAVEKLRGGYSLGEVPAEAIGATCGVDVQNDRLIFAVRAWGPSATSWLLAFGELWGSTEEPEVWNDLGILLQASYGKIGTVRLTLIDSGYRPDRVYEFARRVPNTLPSKGHDGQSRPAFISTLDTNVRGEPQRRGVKLAHIDSSYFKSFVHGKIAWPQDQPGSWHLPIDVSTDYCQQLVAESRIVKPNGTVRWIRTSKNNHALDCEALCAAGAHIMQVHLLQPPKAAPAPADPDAPLPQPRQQQNRFGKWPSPGGGSGSNWATSWRR